MEITGHTAEILEDPFGLLQGERFEFFLDIEVDEEDELYTDNGLMLKVIFSLETGEGKVRQYYFIERSSEKVLDFALEDDEEKQVQEYCQAQLPQEDMKE
ncbi:DUF6509 family protein [Mesobacillus zeae]|uniref:Pullulanase n=1 Tax=Mesobacillus zeae TaxID=1917180 RepID=A0A398BCK7_9BACI|nr:DUF6509 family protein [Mesobacillus zeae]RID85540.1 pullulanase [Mesobacillus zeae]